MIGNKLEPVYKEIHDALWEYEASENGPPGFSAEGFKYAAKIFMSALMEQMWIKQQFEDMPLNKRGIQAEELGNKLRDLVLEYTGYDTKKAYENETDKD